MVAERVVTPDNVWDFIQIGYSMAEKTPVGDMPRMVPDRDDIRQRSNIQPKREPAPAPVKVEKPAQTSWVMITLLLVAGVSIGFLALQQYSMTQLLNSYEERLELADDRIVYLERALTETDESVALNGTAINAQFKAIKTETDFQMSEIRKLWDVANKRNRTWIEDNQAAIKGQAGKVGSLETSLASLQESQASDESVLTSLTTELNTEKSKLLAAESELNGLEEEIATVSRAIESMIAANYEERMLTLTLTQENLLAEQGGIDSKIDGNASNIGEIQASIESIDAYRLETSQRLSAILNQIESLDARITALTGSPQ